MCGDGHWYLRTTDAKSIRNHNGKPYSFPWEIYLVGNDKGHVTVSEYLWYVMRSTGAKTKEEALSWLERDPHVWGTKASVYSWEAIYVQLTVKASEESL